MRTLRTLALALSVLALSVLGTVSVAAVSIAAAQEPDAAEDRAMAFEAAAEGAQTENVPGGALLIAAYGLVWLFVLGYVVSIGYRQTQTRADIERLRRDLASAKKRAGEG